MIKAGRRYRHTDWTDNAYMYVNDITDGVVSVTFYFTHSRPHTNEYRLKSFISKYWVVYVDKDEELDKL